MSQRSYWTVIVDKLKFICKIILKQVYIRITHLHFFIVHVSVRLNYQKDKYILFSTYIVLFSIYTIKRGNKDEMFWNRSLNVTCTGWISAKIKAKCILRNLWITRMCVGIVHIFFIWEFYRIIRHLFI